MTFDSLISALRDTDTMLPLLGSVLAGALIGADREFLGKPAGLRTHTLVCFASALMTLLGLRMAEWTMVLPKDTQIVSEIGVAQPDADQSRAARSSRVTKIQP